MQLPEQLSEGDGRADTWLMSNVATLAPITDSEQARLVDLSARVLRAALWASAAHYVAIAVLLKIYTHIPLVVAVSPGFEDT